jgi:hypothetical protein
MKKLTGHRIAVLALAGLLGACGGGGGAGEAGSGKDDSAPPVRSSEYAGKVADEKGLPVAGIAVRLEDRTTDEVTEVLTAADGSFSAAVEPGVYDITFDDPDAKEYVSVQKTAVDLRAPQAAPAPAPAPAPVQVRLPAARPLASNLLQGTASYPDGKPAAHRKLLIEPAIARTGPTQAPAVVPDPVMVETDAQGTFTQLLGTPGMDLDFDVKIIAINAPKLDMEKLAFNYQFVSKQAQASFFEAVKNYIARYAQESINIHKTDGAMQLELKLDSPVHNLRSATGTPNGIPEDERRLVVYTGEHGSENSPVETPPAPATDRNQFKLSLSTDQVAGTPRAGMFSGGKLDVSKNCDYRSFKDITSAASGAFDTEYSRNTFICVTNTTLTKIFTPYKVVIKTDRPGDYRFTDESGNTHSLMITGLRLNQSHTVRYDSKKPAITGIQFTLSK